MLIFKRIDVPKFNTVITTFVNNWLIFSNIPLLNKILYNVAEFFLVYYTKTVLLTRKYWLFTFLESCGTLFTARRGS